MSTNFPTSLDTFVNPTSGNTLNSPDHAGQHSNANDAITALETKVGANSSAVTTSHDYKLSGVTGTDKAASKTGVETFTNKTLTSPIINVGSDATGDLYYRNSGGTFTRLPIGTVGQIIDVSAGGLPEWVNNPAVANASYVSKGAVQGLTDAATSGLTISSGVISVNSGTSANNIVKLDASAKLPAVDGSQLTNIVNPLIEKNGTTTRDLSTASGSQTIAHGAGKTLKYARFTVTFSNTTTVLSRSDGQSNGTQHNCSYVCQVASAGVLSTIAQGTDTNCIRILADNSGNYQTATASFDSTNITLTWTKTGTPTGTANIVWEAIA